MKKETLFSFILTLLLFVPTKAQAMSTLPNTGESNSWIFILIAAVAVVAGIWLVVSSRKKK
ncbi:MULTISPECIES: LPXTG cell wall anchor domain-containing protein [Ruoffia]|nr:LPXTG cell wall anchor domain-containing protein [Ruoffia tabacinasalis]MBG9978331.1 LPXTG cell wall anchor domain-containing protein [Ruoffia tabacinasalis]HJG47680.1 LPXTG cell wall anchor domain-containing protein [Ruoffia tabacinasalis]